MPANNAQIYHVQAGDTLSAIAVKTGKTVRELASLNGLKNPNKLDVGQVLYLNKETAFSAQALFLDALRHPIENLVYKLVIDGKALVGTTPKDGLSPETVTRNAKSKIEVYAKDIYGNWQHLASTISDYGKKIITLVSPDILFKDQLRPHPVDAPTAPQPATQPRAEQAYGKQPPIPMPGSGDPTKNNPNVKKKHKKGKKGESIVQLEISLPLELLRYFEKYTGKELSQDQWERMALSLQCEPNVLKAIAVVESGGRVAFWKLNGNPSAAYIPQILFERQKFQYLTKGEFDRYPDISGAPRKAGTYGGPSTQYLRLINAYRLAPNEAIEACSWGKFQILGMNWRLCGQSSINDFISKMCTDECGQIELLANFIKNKKDVVSVNDMKHYESLLLKAVQNKDWFSIARYYNGPNYKKFKYDEKLKSAYECQN